MTRPIALAAPVVDGMMLIAAARARLKILVWKIEDALVIRITMDRAHERARRPNLSCNTFAIGARQFVVQLALETILCFAGSKMLS